MSPSLFEISIAAVMLAVTAGLVAWFWNDMAAGSERRTMDMLASAGVGNIPADQEAIMQDARRRCRRCPSEGLCERRLAGSIAGDNSFCPNVQIFRRLADTA